MFIYFYFSLSSFPHHDSLSFSHSPIHCLSLLLSRSLYVSPHLNFHEFLSFLILFICEPSFYLIIFIFLSSYLYLPFILSLSSFYLIFIFLLSHLCLLVDIIILKCIFIILSFSLFFISFCTYSCPLSQSLFSLLSLSLAQSISILKLILFKIFSHRSKKWSSTDVSIFCKLK